MSSFGIVRDRQQGWQAGLGDISPDLREQVDALVQGGRPSMAAIRQVSISDWPAAESHQVTALRRRMVRAVLVCMLSSICATLAGVALGAFAQSGWDAVHPWVSLMALVGSIGLLAIGLGILFTASQLPSQGS